MAESDHRNQIEIYGRSLGARFFCFLAIVGTWDQEA